jgi:hypothetical protein
VFPNLAHADQIDPVQSAADFYLLFGLSGRSIVTFPSFKQHEQSAVIEAAIKLGLSFNDLQKRNEEYARLQINHPSERLNSIAKDAETEFKSLVDFIDAVFIDYVNAACGGELRHHKAAMCVGGDSASRYQAWFNWGSIFIAEGPNALIEMRDLFLDFNNGSYGGPPWAAAAQLLHERINQDLASSYLENQVMFVDRVFNLQHNTGCFLNKLDWTNKRVGREGADENYRSMTETVLVAHSSNPPDISKLYQRASSKVQTMVEDTISIALEKNLPINGVWVTERESLV